MQHGRPYPDPEAAGVCCPRCGRINTPGERRCGRCQSRLVREPIQQTLDLGIRWPKVVSIDWVAPERRPLRSAAARPSGSRKARRARPAPQGQLELDLQPLPELPAARRPLDQPELVPAPLARRAAALLVDGALALTAYGIILAVAQLGIALWSGVNLRWDRPVLIAWAVVLAAVQLGYRCFCVGAGVDSPGLRWMGLRLLRFDRRPPRLRDRWLRFAAGLISTAGLCAGWLWALLSSDRLSWADLISRTCAVRADRSEPGAR
ncbi:MAG: RDD family protein [Bryobacterales bacterium]|nr:RDD family protein [Bryobacteraceae bacterium]MDW8128905.1 RDD family protein [Bryobacterales bacterium]